MKQLKSIVDQNGNVVELNAMMRSAYVNAVVMGAGVAASDTVPAGAAYVLISLSVSATPTYVNFSAAAAIPGAGISTGLSPIVLNGAVPRLFSIDGATAISLINSGACVATLEYFGPLD